MQTLILGKSFLVQLFNGIYFWLDFPLIVLVGLWLYFRHRRQYTLTRDAMLISGGIALIIYHMFPVAPPRYLTDFGFVDTMAMYSSLSYQAQSTAPFVNPYAAVPSLHVGWPVLLAVGVITATRFKPVWVMIALLPVAQFFAVVFTANHFIFDAMIGVCVALCGLAVALFMQKWGYTALGKLLGLVPRDPPPMRRAHADERVQLSAAGRLRPPLFYSCPLSISRAIADTARAVRFDVSTTKWSQPISSHSRLIRS